MPTKIMLIDIDAICGKNILTKRSKPRITTPMINFIADVRQAGIKTILCGWDKNSENICKDLRSGLGADAVAVSPAYLGNRAFPYLFEQYGSNAKNAFYVASNPFTRKMADKFQIASLNIHIENPIALVKGELLSSTDKTSREQFQLLKEGIKEFKNS